MIFPKPHTISKRNGSFKLNDRLTVNCSDEKFISAFDYLKVTLYSVLGIECLYVEDNADVEFIEKDLCDEEYSLDIANNGILIGSSNLRGAIYAVSSLIQMVKVDEGFSIPCASVLDTNYSEIRGVHFYMPAREEISSFKRIIDTMAFLKMNTVILEVGAGMEYDRHPEINTSWVKFCENIKKIPGFNGYKNFQGSDFYWKDSVHTELCEGSYLTKAEVRDLVEYCKSRGMDVIPEVQGLSHSYYLTVAHPEIAELQDDPFPDTYCPNNEKSYELYFDIAEEVIEVFEPETVSIGHDEIRVLGWCEKCKGKSGEELVGKEILRLYEFYKSKGIRITMWGESVQSFISYKGGEVGTKDVERHDRYGRYYQLPASYKAIDMLPSDILMIDWQHATGHDSEGCYNERGFEVIYGNFHGSLIGEWQNRTAKECYRGAEVSSWCPATEEIFARDGIFFEMAFSAHILWREGYTNDKYDAVVDDVSRVIPYIRAINKGRRSDFASGKDLKNVYLGAESAACQTIDLSKSKASDESVNKILKNLPEKLHGVSVDTGNILIKESFKCDSLLLLHNCKKEMSFFPSHYFMDEANWGLGAYAVCYEDATVEIIPVYYGRQIGYKSFSFSRHRDKSTVNFELDNELEQGDVSSLPCYFTLDNAWAESLMYNTTPIITDDGTVFAYEWKNPHPDKTITKIRPYSVPKVFNQYDMDESIVLFGIVAV